MEIEPVLAIVAIFIGLPWLILHYMTRWKTAPTLTTNDEALLDELYQLARRLEDRMETVERLVAADNPGFRPGRLLASDDVPLEEIEQLKASKVRR
jgi:phage shock protein B